MSLGLMDRTAGHLIAPDGSRVDRPAILLDGETARIIRAYFSWAMRSGLEPELVCASCFDHSRESKATYQITEADITILCGCAIRSWTGPTPKPATIDRGVSVTVEGEPAHVTLPSAAAALLRQYKKVLLALGLKEALRCNVCFEGSQPDGCEASVTDNQIRIRCRCTNRVFVGSSV